jgi:hypothetical protein
MILRRLTQHVKDQNWFAVALDFLIVVVGILIAFQITNWSEARGEKAQANELVARMVSEAASTRGELKDYRGFHKELSESANELTLALNNNERCLAMDETLTLLILQISDFPPPRFSLPNAEQALETGSLSLIRSSELQKKVQSIADEMVFVERQWQRYMRVIQDTNMQVNKAAGVALTGHGEFITKRSYDPTSFDLLTPEKVCKNTELIAVMANVAVTKAVYVDYLDEVEIALDDYLSALSEGD